MGSEHPVEPALAPMLCLLSLRGQLDALQLELQVRSGVYERMLPPVQGDSYGGPSLPKIRIFPGTAAVGAAAVPLWNAAVSP